MPSLWITEYASNGRLSGNDSIQVATIQPLRTQQVSISGTSAQSWALLAETGLVRLYADANAHVSVGGNPTATSADMPIGAGSPEYFATGPDGVTKLACITA